LPANEKKQHLERLQAINNTQLVFMSLQAGSSIFEVVDEELKRKRSVDEVQSEQEWKKIDANTALANKVDAISTLNKQSAEWTTVAQTKTIATCYKQGAGNLPLPTTKQLLLTRYHDIIMCGDASYSTSCNCNGATSSPFSRSYKMTRYDGSLRTSDATTAAKNARSL
jgi:hypothetical protein